MAYKIERINPLDLQPRKAIGVNIPFSGRSVFNPTYTSKEAIKANLINYFLTGRGERFLNPSFGSGLRNLLFENLTETKIRQVQSNIRDGLSFYFPRVVIGELILQPEPDNNLLLFYLKYSISDTNIEDEITINIEQ